MRKNRLFRWQKQNIGTYIDAAKYDEILPIAGQNVDGRLGVPSGDLPPPDDRNNLEHLRDIRQANNSGFALSGDLHDADNQVPATTGSPLQSVSRPSQLHHHAATSSNSLLLNDEFFDPVDHALINRLVADKSPEKPSVGLGGVQAIAGLYSPGQQGTVGATASPVGDERQTITRSPKNSPMGNEWEDKVQEQLSAALLSLYSCEECLQRAEAVTTEEERTLQEKLNEVEDVVKTLRKEKLELETEIHDLQGDTALTDFKLKSTPELRRLIQKFEADMQMVQIVLESRIS